MSEGTTKTPNFAGTWRLIPSQSRLPGPPVRQMSMEIKHEGSDFVQVARVEYADGRIATRTFAGRTTGEPFVIELGRSVVHCRAAWVGQELVIDTVDQSGGAPRRLRDYWSLIEGGRKLKMEHRDDELAGHVGVLERVTP